MKATLGLFAALAIATQLTAQDPGIGPAPGRTIDIGGRRLHLLCSGLGSPTIILEAGASAFAIDWTLVQGEVARHNRVCSYDRAGAGWSDPPATGAGTTIPQDLHSLLHAAGEPPPYILVGASAGGLYVRLYQADYPDEVVGLVLVDPSSEDGLFWMWNGKPVAIASVKAEQVRSIIPLGPVAVPRRAPQTGPPFDRLPADLYALRIRLDEKLIASVPDTVRYEWVLSAAEEERARLARLKEQRSIRQFPLGDRPLVVLTRGVNGAEAAHAAMKQLSSRSRHTVVSGAGHEIHLFQPGAVIQAIADVVEAVQSKRPLRSSQRG